MRVYRKTSIAFGLVNVPVGAYKATESHDVAFKQHHGGECHGGISLVRTCKECAEVVDYADIVKGIDVDGELVIVTGDELKDLEGETSPAIEVLQFIDQSEIDPLAYESSYYLAPDKTSLEGYALIRQVLAETGRVALVRFCLRAPRVHLGVLRVVGKVLTLHTVAWPSEVREPAFDILDKPVELKPAALKMAHALVESMVAPYQPEDHVDTYTERVEELIAAKAGGREFVTKPVESEAVVDDLIAALEASLAKKKAKGKKKVA
jgi:DNA end-binding protein Ku